MTITKALVDDYRKCGFLPFPLAENAKVPMKNTVLSEADKMLFTKKNNIGVFAGSPNGLVVADADEELTKWMLTVRLEALGLLDKTTLVVTPKRGGYHFWLRVQGIPAWAKAYYRLNPDLGKGELRVHKPAYVVAPGSSIPEGEYRFARGGVRYFLGQPAIDFKDLAWLVSPGALEEPKLRTYRRNEMTGDVELPTFRFQPDPPILNLLHQLHVTPPGKPVPKVLGVTGAIVPDEYFPSRSEAEASLVVGLIYAGWGYDEIEELFFDENPPHFAEQANQDKYLENTYRSATYFVAQRLERNKT